MTIGACSRFTRGSDSGEVGRELGEAILGRFGPGRPRLVLVYLTVNHDQPAALRGLGDVLGQEVQVLGCSGQGVMGPRLVAEQGYAAAAIGLGGEGVEVAGGRAERIEERTLEKGRALGRALMERLSERPKVAVLHYDPLCGADMDRFLAGLDAELGCPIVGGAAGHYHGPMQRTFQYFGREVFGHGAVAFAMSGAFTPELAFTSGAAPVGIEATVTRCEGNVVLELDGRSALEVWEEITCAGPPNADHTAALALGVLTQASGSSEYLTRSAFGVDAARGGIVLQAAIPEGTRVMLLHRTADGVQEGARAMAEGLRRRLDGRKVRAVLGFECGARTSLFLGDAVVQRETARLQETVAGDAEWIGLVAWGEIHPVCGRPGFHNFSYPLLALVE